MKNSFLSRTLKNTSIYIISIVILSMIYSKLIVNIPMFIQYALDGVILGNEGVIPEYIRLLFYADSKISKIIILILVLLFINVLIFIVEYIKSKVNTKFNLKVNRNVKETILEHIPKLKYLEFSNIDKANVIQRVNNDATTYAEFFNSQVNIILDTVFISVFAIIQCVKLNTVIGLFIIIVCVLIVALSIWYFKATKKLTKDIVDMNKTVIEKTTTNVEESKMLKAFNRQIHEETDFIKLNKKYKEKELKFARIKGFYLITIHSLRNFKEPFILLYGGILVVNGKLTLAILSILLSYATKVFKNIYICSEKLAEINLFIVAYRKLSNLMNCKEDVETKPDIALNGDIVFKNVSIKIGENTILENINFTIGMGENVAIIGDNGAGKTVIAKTLIGFYEYTGDIYIGKHNIRDISKKSIRDYIGVVLQDTYLFTDTIKNNIDITERNVSNEEIINACKLADVYNDIKIFDKNINYLVGKGGNNISGGQKQRIAIARTLLLDNKFIIFDDSLSKLDTKTKINILNNIIEMKRGCIIITHDTEIVKKCSKVLFINNKTIKVDTYENLIKDDEMYRQIIEISKNKILEDEEF